MSWPLAFQASCVGGVCVYLSRIDLKIEMIVTKIFLMMSVQNSSWQSKGEFEAEKKRCSEIGLTILEMNRYLKYPRDHLSFAKSLCLPLIISGAV